MAIKRPGKEAPKKVTQAELGRLLGVSRKTIYEWSGKGEFPKAEGDKYSAFDVLVWYLVTHSKQLVEKGAGDLASGDPLLAGENTPNLERYRGARADLAEMEVKRQEGNLVDRSAMRELLGRAAGLIRGAAKSLQRAFGEEARRILDDSLDEVDREFSKVFGDRDSGDEKRT